MQPRATPTAPPTHPIDTPTAHAYPANCRLFADNAPTDRRAPIPRPPLSREPILITEDDINRHPTPALPRRRPLSKARATLPFRSLERCRLRQDGHARRYPAAFSATTRISRGKFVAVTLSRACSAASVTPSSPSSRDSGAKPSPSPSPALYPTGTTMRGLI